VNFAFEHWLSPWGLRHAAMAPASKAAQAAASRFGDGSID
jgi:hypothetical protein